MKELGIPPIEKYDYDGHDVYVVRDDLTSKFPGPNNSKVRGLLYKLQELHERGVKTIASQDTSISRIGWGVSWLAKKFDMTHYNFYPAKKGLNFYQRMSKYWGGKLVPLPGTFSNAFRVAAMKWMARHNVKAEFLPIGLSMPEAVQANADLVSILPSDLFEGSLIISVSSGTICAGLFYGTILNNYKTDIYGVMSSSFKNRRQKIIYLVRRTALGLGRPIKVYDSRLKLIDLGYKYKQREFLIPPFPCDLFLDRKAWKFLVDNIDKLKEPIVFWNVGGEWDPEKGLIKGLRGDGFVKKPDIEKFLRKVR
jgi:1-aminocyclopropane-1-carboxylate deaminase/D-cysteine desulfhydrase-like pyridoxal-dependent ACC family enzyme